VKGLYPAGNVEWTSELKMNLQPENTGTGNYQDFERNTVFGIQQVKYFPQTRSLYVVGLHTSVGNPVGFVRHWKYKEQ
jgi:hypothetical protein